MESTRHPEPRPHASWVMGHSARWHDPEFTAELGRQELTASMRDVQLLGLGMAAVAAGGGGSVGLMLGLLRRVRRVSAELQRRRRAVD